MRRCLLFFFPLFPGSPQSSHTTGPYTGSGREAVVGFRFFLPILSPAAATFGAQHRLFFFSGFPCTFPKAFDSASVGV